MAMRIVLFLSLIFSGTLAAQQRMQGETIVQLKDGKSIDACCDVMNAQLGLLANVKPVRCLYSRMNLWLLEFDEEQVALRDVLYYLQGSDMVVQAQANHIVHERVIPDDPFFSQQWHHLQANDHDIDSELAWDITTGGTTPLGDEIVVCVVELGGAQWNTTDIADNHWVNEHEIPLNGVDDDANGFTDDYHGWNINSQNDVLDNDSHGTRVCSMIGSKGNNNTGVTGVNWDVKMMMVEIGSSTEAAAIAGYAYPLEMRRIYNETNGAQGAYVVATNSSWGTDNGQPSDAPIWCAMYDSLGVHGVLSCASTTNNNMNVDLFGDLPTACPSNYLISVARTNSMDVRASGGYGITTIDLAAPGDAVYLANNTSYQTTTGTSFSSPCVAGAIALLYSVPCSAFTTNARNNPSQAAMLMKDFMLNGVDTTPQLLGEMVSGGRLNVHNSMQLLINACDNGDCMSPFGLDVAQLPGTLNYSISWNDLIVATDYQLNYRPIGNVDWISVEIIDNNTTTLENLLACTNYEVRVAAQCPDSLSTWSQTISWQTDGCCIQPQSIEVVASSSNSITLQWNEVLAASGYEIITVDSDGNEIQWQAGITDSITLIGLSACTQYDITIQSQCDNPQGAGPSTEGFTPGCDDCSLIPYCTSSGNSSAEYIAFVQVGDIERTSTSDAGYVLVTDLTDTLYIEELYSVVCMPGYTGTNYSENFRVWIDYNIDGDFNDDNELVFDPSPTTTQVNGTFTVPSGITEGASRMRVSMTYTPINSNNEPSSCGNLVYGEVEDYCVTLSTSVGIKESTKRKGFLLPNPASTWIQLPNNSTHPMSAEVLGIDGRVAATLTLEQWPRAALPYLPNGMYCVRLRDENGYSAWPLLIEN
jgi:hypothetical protein